MPSSLIDVIRQHAPALSDTTSAVCERQGLLAALAWVPDPCDPRGIRYPLAGRRGDGWGEHVRRDRRLGDDLGPPACGRFGFTGRVPVLSTVWRLLVRIDAEALTAVRADWLGSRLPVAPPAGRRVVAVDGKVVRGAVRPEGRVHPLSAYDTSTGVVLAQVQSRRSRTRFWCSPRCGSRSRPGWVACRVW